MFLNQLKKHFLSIFFLGIVTLELVGSVASVWFIKLYTDQASQAVTILHLYQQIQVIPTQEDALATQYVETSDPALLVQFQTISTTFDPLIHKLDALQHHQDWPILQTLVDEHQHYLATAQGLFAAVNARQFPLAHAMNMTQANPEFHAMLTTLHNAADRAYNTANTAQSNLESELIRTCVTIALNFGIGYFVLIFILRRQAKTRQQLDRVKQRELERLQQAALIDNLTGIGNHRAYQEDVQREILRAARRGFPLTLVLIDIDHFKEINDQYSHSAGDQMLCAVSALLQRFLTPGQTYRIGGDQFAVLLPHVILHQASILLEALRQAAQDELNGTTISIGVAELKALETDPQSLKEQANAALNAAKRQGRNQLVRYDTIQENASLLTAKRILALRQVIAEQRIEIVFQPIWDMQRHHLLAVEALSRPDISSGFQGPQELFDTAEHAGHEAELDKLCITATLQRQAKLPKDILLFINLCPQSLDQDLLRPAQLAEIVRAAGVPIDQIVWEITERTIHRLDAVIDAAKQLKMQGFKIALDDIGAGNSGLEMLTKLAVDFVKIDRNVLIKAQENKTAHGVLTGMIAMAREINSYVIIEGIEDPTMLRFIDQIMGPTQQRYPWGAQGYLLGVPAAPMPSYHYPFSVEQAAA
jgi:diguanylate cyclase (GGDEF)-like protein